MAIDEKAVWQRVTAAGEGGREPLQEAIREAAELLAATAALSTGKGPWPELLGSQKSTLRGLRGLARRLGWQVLEGRGKGRSLPGKSYRERLVSLVNNQERQARTLEALATTLGDPACRLLEGEAREAWDRWRRLLQELGR